LRGLRIFRIPATLNAISPANVQCAHKFTIVSNNNNKFLAMRRSIYLVLALAITMASSYSHAYTVCPSRRAFLARTVTAGATLVAASQPAKAADQPPQQEKKETKEEAAKRKAEEKEARRQAEETKKRLAVGRIGTI
jgi:hypothetical protein